MEVFGAEFASWHHWYTYHQRLWTLSSKHMESWQGLDQSFRYYVNILCNHTIFLGVRIRSRLDFWLIGFIWQKSEIDRLWVALCSYGCELMLHLKLMFQITFLQLLKVGRVYVNVRLCIDHLVLIHCSILTLGRAALLQAMVNRTRFTSWVTQWFFSN